MSGQTSIGSSPLWTQCVHMPALLSSLVSSQCCAHPHFSLHTPPLDSPTHLGRVKKRGRLALWTFRGAEKLTLLYKVCLRTLLFSLSLSKTGGIYWPAKCHFSQCQLQLHRVQTGHMSCPNPNRDSVAGSEGHSWMVAGQFVESFLPLILS